MSRALEQARLARGWSSPNPPVGAVVVRDGRLVGLGRTQPPGQAHAEVAALAQAGAAAAGADLYVTLEPCCHFGRTPPCCDAIVAAGVRRVIAAQPDPNPAVDGRGVACLRAAGIEVVVGDGATAAAALIEGFTTHLLTGRPLVIAKYAMSLDGRIATATGHARWISGPDAREHLHRLRASVDAILVGSGTVAADDPLLTARPPVPATTPHQPLRVVLDSTGRLPATARVFDPALPATTLVATTGAMLADQRQALIGRGVEILMLPADDGGVDLTALLAALGDRGVTTLLVEGGAHIHGSFFAAGLVHKVVSYVAPVIIGGAAAPGPVAGRGALTMDQALRLANTRVERLGADVLIEGYVPATCGHLPLAGDGELARSIGRGANWRVEVG